MGTLDEIKKMKGRGMSQEQIIKSLREKKIQYKDISDALAQSDIKAAVEHQPDDLPPQPQLPPMQNLPPQQGMQASEESDAPMFSEDGKNQMPQMDTGMQPSQMYDEQSQNNWEPPVPSDAYGGNQQDMNPSQAFPVPSDQAPSQGQGMPGYESSGYNQYPEQQYAQEEYPQEAYAQQDYGNYPAMSSDTITEVAEQVVAQRLSDIRKPLEKVISMKTNMDSQIESIEERLKHIEKIMHTLQTSVLGKVGEFMTNVQDIKKEMIETQKTFAKATHTKHKTATKRKHHKKKK